MRKNFFKKISAVALSLTMVVGMVGLQYQPQLKQVQISLTELSGRHFQFTLEKMVENGKTNQRKLVRFTTTRRTLSRAMAKMLSLLQLQQTEMHYLTLQVQVIVLSGHQWELQQRATLGVLH